MLFLRNISYSHLEAKAARRLTKRAADTTGRVYKREELTS
jgi:hypothetical protein